MSTLSPTVEVSFTLNSHDVQLSGVDPNTTLNEWIRSQLGLSGTKKMCGEGGCGCCVVSVQRKDPTTGKDTAMSINSVSFSYNPNIYTFGQCNTEKIYIAGALFNLATSLFQGQK